MAVLLLGCSTCMRILARHILLLLWAHSQSYYSDLSHLSASCFPLSGGTWIYNHSSRAGMFNLSVNNGVSASWPDVGSYYSDYSELYASGFPLFGGIWRYGSQSGMFYLHVHHSASDAYAFVGSSYISQSYYSDYSFLYAECILRFGGDYGYSAIGSKSTSGMFYGCILNPVATTGAFVGSAYYIPQSYYSDASWLGASCFPAFGEFWATGDGYAGSNAGLFVLYVYFTSGWYSVGSAYYISQSYYSDHSTLYASCILAFGGGWLGNMNIGDGSAAGLFYFDAFNPTSRAVTCVGSILSYTTVTFLICMLPVFRYLVAGI